MTYSMPNKLSSLPFELEVDQEQDRTTIRHNASRLESSYVAENCTAHGISVQAVTEEGIRFMHGNNPEASILVSWDEIREGVSADLVAAWIERVHEYEQRSSAFSE